MASFSLYFGPYASKDPGSATGQWDEFRRAQPELDVLYSRLRFQGKRYRSRIYGEPMPDLGLPALVIAVFAAVAAAAIVGTAIWLTCIASFANVT
uniref:Uncharacterized protein n=1 Tax=Oryza meridionalis TaxID=40149 RepID=A0A0E0DFK8_9ORYZ